MQRSLGPKRRTCTGGIAANTMLGAWFQSFRSRRSLPRGTTQLSVILRKRNGWVRAKALFRASLASIWQNCVLERVPDLLLLSAELVVDGDFQLFYPSRAAPLLCRRWYLSSVKRGNQHVAPCVPYLVRGTRSGARYHNQIHGFLASRKSCRSCNPRKNGGVTWAVI